jgi:hypothetical protein
VSFIALRLTSVLEFNVKLCKKDVLLKFKHLVKGEVNISVFGIEKPKRPQKLLKKTWKKRPATKH